MRLEVVKERDDYLEVAVEGEDESVLDAVSEVLQSMPGVHYAGHRLLHPLTGRIVLVVKTDPAQVKARDALLKGLSELAEMADELRSMAERLPPQP